MPLRISGNGLSASAMGTGLTPYYKFAERNTTQTLTYNTYVDHITLTFTLSTASNVLLMFLPAAGYESGISVAHMKFTVDGVDTGGEFVTGRTTSNNGFTAAPRYWYVNNMAAGAHTVKVWLKLLTNTTVITPYTRGEVTRTYLGAIIYGT
jgi:hypothetical protein